MGTISQALLLLVVSIIAYVIYKAWKVNQFWKERGVPYVKPLLFFGNALPMILRKKTPGEIHEEICKQFPNEPIVGFYNFASPTLIVRDLDYVERVVIKDFVHFVDHGLPLDEDNNPLDSNLFSMNGKRWRATRNKLSPIFTTGKLKLMYESMAECGNELISQMDKTEVQDIEIKDILGCFAMDTIGSCAFGIDAGNLAKPDNEFRRMGKNAITADTATFIRFFLLTNFPAFSKFLRLTFNKPEFTKYFAKIIKETLKYRRDNNYKRNDFVQLMMQLQDKGYVEIHTKDESDDYLNIDQTYTVEKFELTDDQLTGHAVNFLGAGFDATTATMMYALYELSKHQIAQEKVRDEILKQVKQAGNLTYDSIKEMTYLEQCVKETLRKYPPPPMVLRECTKEYTFPNGITIQPGQAIIIPVPAIHYDPKTYPEPHKFKPERYDPENVIPSCAFMPFGNGPRMCIGMRFALLEIKFGLAKLLMNYSFKLSPKTKEPLTLSKHDLITLPNEKIYLNFTKLKA